MDCFFFLSTIGTFFFYDVSTVMGHYCTVLYCTRLIIMYVFVYVIFTHFCFTTLFIMVDDCIETSRNSYYINGNLP